MPPPSENDIRAWTDKYFVRTKETVGRFGDSVVTYAVFMRRPVISTPRLMVRFLEEVAEQRSTSFDIRIMHAEGHWVGAGDPIAFITGSFYHLVDLETPFLQRLGAPCVAAYNAYAMCLEMPRTGFLAMDARHCAGTEMAELMAYGASVGSTAAQRNAGAIGFVGNATDATAHWFGAQSGRGTMPHALIGYAGSTLRAAEMFHETFPAEDLVVLVDYYGREVSDTLAVCERFPDIAEAGRLAVRLDTHGGRFMEELDQSRSYEVLEAFAADAIRGYRSERELRYLVGPGVSAASVWHLRDRLDRAGFPNVRIVASSGFNPEKCRVFGSAKAPVDVIGTGSFIPEDWPETYATADVIAYDGNGSVKAGREFLLRYWHDDVAIRTK